MKQRVFVVHGWGTDPGKEWFPWLKDQLEQKGIEVLIPAMPDTDHPVIDAWVGVLRTVVGERRDSDIFVGHSIGCQTIIRYLAEGQETPIKGLLCVAGWFMLNPLETEEEEAIALPWVNTPIDFTAVKHMARHITAIFSDDDPYVDLEENKILFEQRLGAQIIVEHNKGHFSEDNGIYELPVVRDCIIELLDK